MSEVTSSKRAPSTDADYEAAIDELLGEMRRLNAGTGVWRAERDRLKAETLQLKAETRAIIAGVGLAI